MVPERVLASSLVALGIAVHFFGFECSRAASIALLASEEPGLGAEALPFTVALGAPSSALVLYLYARSIRLNGPRATLRMSEAWCLAIFLVIIRCSPASSQHELLGRFLVVFFYCFREIYVSLLSTQYWSLVASILDKHSCAYLVRFTAGVSVASAVGGYCVQLLVSRFGVRGLLFASVVCVCASSLCAEGAALTMRRLGGPEVAGHALAPRGKGQSALSLSVWRASLELVRRNPVLWLLYVEAVARQTCSNLLNLMFHDMLRRSVVESSARAVLVGRFFATVNTAACALQLLVLPLVVSQRTLPSLLLLVPALVLLMLLLAYAHGSSLSIMLAFGSLKVLEYSVLTSVAELVYMPFGADVRYLGKELVKFFGGKLGKSGSSLTLSALVAHLGPSVRLQTAWALLLALAWLGSMHLLARHLRQTDAHKKDDDLGAPAEVAAEVEDSELESAIISTTTSESNLTNCSGAGSASDDSVEPFSIDEMTPPDGWVAIDAGDGEQGSALRRVRFALPRAALPESQPEAQREGEERVTQPVFLRIGSSAVCLDSLGDDDRDDASAAAFEKTGFYW